MTDSSHRPYETQTQNPTDLGLQPRSSQTADLLVGEERRAHSAIRRANNGTAGALGSLRCPTSLLLWVFRLDWFSIQVPRETQRGPNLSFQPCSFPQPIRQIGGLVIRVISEIKCAGEEHSLLVTCSRVADRKQEHYANSAASFSTSHRAHTCRRQGTLK